MTPRIEKLAEIQLIGKKLKMSFANDKTVALWSGFSPRRKEIGHTVSENLYAVSAYPNLEFFESFDLGNEFERWAAMEVSQTEFIPEGMEKLIIPAGKYAVFSYKGKPSEAQKTFQYIHSQWLPNSEFRLDDRPHFAVMGEKYKGEQPDSEEEFWIPIQEK